MAGHVFLGLLGQTAYLLPAFTRIVGAIKGGSFNHILFSSPVGIKFSFLGFKSYLIVVHKGIDHIRIGTGHIDACASHIFGRWQTFVKLFPVFTSIGRFPDPVIFVVFVGPGIMPLQTGTLPGSGIKHFRIPWIHHQVIDPAFRTFVQDLLPALPSIGGFV